MMENKHFSKKDCSQDLRNLDALISELNHDPQRLAKFIQLWEKSIKNILPGIGCKCYTKIHTEFTDLLTYAQENYTL